VDGAGRLRGHRSVAGRAWPRGRYAAVGAIASGTERAPARPAGGCRATRENERGQFGLVDAEREGRAGRPGAVAAIAAPEGFGRRGLAPVVGGEAGPAGARGTAGGVRGGRPGAGRGFEGAEDGVRIALPLTGGSTLACGAEPRFIEALEVGHREMFGGRTPVMQACVGGRPAVDFVA
jgi:hypothetical protein